MTSVVKEIGNSVFDTVKSASEGRFSSEPYIGTLKNNGVTTAPFHDFDSRVPAPSRPGSRSCEIRSSTAPSMSPPPTTPPDRPAGAGAPSLHRHPEASPVVKLELRGITKAFGPARGQRTTSI